MNTRLGNILFWAGLIGAAICIFYAIDKIWVYESGRSLLLTSGHFVTLEDMLIAVAISVAMALLSWRSGVAARLYFDKAAEKKATPKGPPS